LLSFCHIDPVVIILKASHLLDDSHVKGNTHEHTSDQKKEHAQLWMTLAKVHHSMFIAGKDGINQDVAYKNIETAEIYAFDRAFSRLYELREACDIPRQDPQFLDCVNLMVQILEVQDKVIEASVWRKLYLPGGQPALSRTISRTTTDKSDDAGKVLEETSAQAEYNKQFKLLNTPGRPPISNSIVFDLPERFHELLSYVKGSGGDVDERCKDKQWTPLMYAVNCDHKASCSCKLAMEKLLHEGANINATVGEGKDIETALHQAVAAGRDEKVHYLLRKGADKNICAPYTPLATAVKKNEAQLVELLLDHGAEPPIDKNGWTLLHHAVSSSSYDALTVLLRFDYQESHKDKLSVEARCLAKKTPLLQCAEFLNRPMSLAIAEELLNHNADPNALDPNGRSPLYFATIKRFDPMQTNRENFVTQLLHYGADYMKTPEKFRSLNSNMLRYLTTRAAMERSPDGSWDALRRKNSATSSFSDKSRRDSGSTCRSFETANTKEVNSGASGGGKSKLSKLGLRKTMSRK